MRLAVVSHKVCWPSAQSPTGYATDGGFPIQMRAIASLFDETVLLVPVDVQASQKGEVALGGRALTVVPLSLPQGRGLQRKVRLLAWFAFNLPRLLREVRRADAVHAPIPGDVGTVGILLALALGKPLFVRHCGNWRATRTIADLTWRWLLERIGGARNVVLATGGDGKPPSTRNPRIRWIFSTSLANDQLTVHAKPRTKLPGGDPRLVIACRQDRRKGTGVVIAALASLRRTFPGISLDVLGDGPDLEVFQQEARSLGVSDITRFHGRISQDAVLTHLRSADVFCFPTAASEGFPKAVLEALACGLPVVTTRISVLPTLVETGAGRLVSAAESHAVAEAVRWVLEDERRYVAMSRAAVATARQYSLERWTLEIREQLSAGWGRLTADV